MFASLTALALFIALAWLERSFLNHMMDAALYSPGQSPTDSIGPPSPDIASTHPLPQDS
jgi:hypothetical protein